MDQHTAAMRLKSRGSISSEPMPFVKPVENHIDSSEYAKRLGPQLRPIITSFLADVGYETPPKVKNDALWEAMLLRAYETRVPLDTIHSERCFEVGFTYAAVGVEPKFHHIHI